jgi:hypothetical protein
MSTKSDADPDAIILAQFGEGEFDSLGEKRAASTSVRIDAANHWPVHAAMPLVSSRFSRC